MQDQLPQSEHLVQCPAVIAPTVFYIKSPYNRSPEMSTTTLIPASAITPDTDTHILIDCRHDLANPDAGRIAYAEGHLPGARFAQLDNDLSGAKTAADGSFAGRHPLPAMADFIETLRRLGVNDDSQVVVYDAHGGMFAARLWWMLRWAGHAQVAVLDGGLPAWIAAGGVTTTATTSVTHGNINAQPTLTRTVNVDQVLASLGSTDLTIVDARAADRFRGENETLDRVGGHIPGAKNRCFKDNLQADGRFKPADQLRAEFSSVLATPATGVMQCGSGVTACHNLLALEIAGLTGAALYPGSWSQWSADTSRPVATGA
jgi:thiosulfate/3-mercaptopyruvate sulfurtransferase